VPKRRWLYSVSLLTFVFLLVNQRSGAASTTPGFKITASSIDISGRGEATSQYTIASLNGFAGKVAVICSGPDPNLFPGIVMPSCAEPTQELTLAANGTASDGMIFHPPWVDLSARNRPSSPHAALPLFASALLGLSLLRLRRRLNRSGALLLGLASLGTLTATVGCLGSGGLQMTPGTYVFTLTGIGDGVKATGNVSVTVKCNTCP
jgi:hypothetical protein